MSASRSGAFFLAATLLGMTFWSGVLPGARPRAAHAQDTWPTAPVTIAPEALAMQGIVTAVTHDGALPEHVDAPAYLSVDDRLATRIRPVGAGRVEQVLVVPGQSVRRGQVLLTYDNFTMSDDKQRLASAQAALAQARAAESDAALAYGRARELRGAAVSAGEAERRRARLADARGMVRQSEALLENARERMARFSSHMERSSGIVTHVVAPRDGIVRAVNVTAGQDVSSTTLPVVEVDDLTKLWIISQIDEDDAVELARGDRQLTWLREDEPPIESRIDIIEGAVDPATRHVLVRSLIHNPDERLRPDMLVQTRLFGRKQVAGQIVPAAAVQTIGGVACVFVRTSSDHYVARRVRTGPSLDGMTVITEGLAAGETVVAKGSFTVKSQALLSAGDATQGAGPATAAPR